MFLLTIIIFKAVKFLLALVAIKIYCRIYKTNYNDSKMIK